MKNSNVVAVLMFYVFYLTACGSEKSNVVIKTCNSVGVPISSYSSIISSSDGTKLAVADQGGYIYTSEDKGANWTERRTSGMRLWTSIASSADGTKLAATVDYGYIYTSGDSGATWTERKTAGAREWSSVASSSDGAMLAATDIAENGYIYTSTDSGATWIESTSAGHRGWRSIASSADGQKLAAVAENGGRIYTSADGGVIWTSHGDECHSYCSWRGIASSADGSKLVSSFCTYNDIHCSIYTSSDSGETWIDRQFGGDYWPGEFGYSVFFASSADGTKLAASSSSGGIYASTDSGKTWPVTWQSQAGNFGTTEVAMPADGSFIAAVASYSSSIYICK